jgi:hypothetical protein
MGPFENSDVLQAIASVLAVTPVECLYRRLKQWRRSEFCREILSRQMKTWRTK